MKRLKEKLKYNNGGITLISLVITIIVLMILAGVSIATLIGEGNILINASKAKEETDKSRRKETEDIEKIIYYMTGEDKSGANYPILKDKMKKVYWKEDGSEVTEDDEDFEIGRWYSYEVTEDENMEDGGTTNGGNSKWANAVVKDANGNSAQYYVWIPRYAYKIDKSVAYESQSGTSYKIDVKFLERTSSEVEEGYIVHPAFTFGDQQLEGIWVGKYETSGEETEPKIIPNVGSKRNINLSKMFDMAKVLSTTNIDSHVMKNIEWGAVAYLTQSQYGRNGTEVSVYQCSNYITGSGRGGTLTDGPIYHTETYANPNPEQQYNGKIGKLSSTTGNIYGIYDMSGGSYEYVMGFYGTEENIPALGNTGFSTVPERKYYDLYINKTSVDSTNIGDALFETKGWNSDFGSFVSLDNPVFKRGGRYGDIYVAGVFDFDWQNGGAGGNVSFRICIVTE